MAKYLKPKQPARKSATRINNSSGTSGSGHLRKLRNRIYQQILLTVLTVALTVVVLFAMTSAWYTNVVQTSGLVFEAEAWGFDGEITVNEEPITAAPGDDGVVHLSVVNDSDGMSSISVNISKNGMSERMQRRLFFYVDAPMNRNGETMERVYLNKYEGYTYNVFSQGRLTLTEQVSNAPIIKWQWVYDVLGYYVLAQPYEIETPIDVVNEDGTTSTKMVRARQMSIKEYLRPIEYNFDDATTEIGIENDEVSLSISTVDGTTSPEAFLQQLSQKDGYEGEIQLDSEWSFKNYYAVDVDENGYGVYAYLCNYTDIMMETDYDTMLGELAYKQSKGETLEEAQAALLSHKVTLTLSAQKNEADAVNVSTLGALRSAIDLGTSSIIQLSSDITLAEGESLTIPADARVMLDLNSYSIKNMSGTAIKAEPGSSLTMLNGAIVNDTVSAAKTYGIYATGAEVVLNEVDIDQFQYGIYVGDQENSNELDSRVHMLDCNITADICAAFISGNGVLSEHKSQLVIENSMLKSGVLVVAGNGDSAGNGRWGTDIQIIDSEIIATGDGSGIYHPQKNSTMTIYNSKVTGYTAMAIKGGTVSILKSDLHGTGAYQEPSFDGSGFTDTGDAVYIETGYGYEIRLEIGQESVLRHTDGQSKSLRIYDASSDNVSVLIESGTFDEAQPEKFLAKTSSVRYENGKTIVVPGA